jgi:hypothetical protein
MGEKGEYVSEAIKVSTVMRMDFVDVLRPAGIHRAAFG